MPIGRNGGHVPPVWRCGSLFCERSTPFGGEGVGRVGEGCRTAVLSTWTILRPSGMIRVGRRIAGVGHEVLGGVR